jgi:predicted TPR repeat methyltransferase
VKPLPRSSGDILADRRADYAEMLFESGDPVAAAELMLNALELAPGWALGWFRLGEMYEAANQKEPAIAAWRTVLKLDPDGQTGAVLKLELAGAIPKSSAPPRAFVEALFDQYAETFDASLVEKLGYRVPDLLLEAVKPFAPFGTAVDLGCGTGLMGEKLRPLTGRLEGCDISAAMLKKAEAKKVYDRLEKADLQTLELTAASADLIIAADVFMYLGALDGIARIVSHALKPGGLFSFSVERNNGSEAFRLRESRRYAHSEAYVRGMIGEAGLEIATIGHETIRMDRGEAIEGLIVLAKQNA